MKVLLPALAAVLLVACSDPVSVVVHAPSLGPDAALIFDGKDTLRMQGAVDSIRLAPSAEHTCSTPDGRSITFRVGERGGLLAIDSGAHVLFNVEYRSKAAASPGPKVVVGYVLVDSCLVYRKMFAGDDRDDADALRIAGLVEKQGNFAEVIMPMARKAVKSYPKSKEVAGVRMIGPGEVYTERYWDFDLGRTIPSTITGQVQEGFETLDTERSRTAMLPAEEFLLFARAVPEEYAVIDLRAVRARSVAP